MKPHTMAPCDNNKMCYWIKTKWRKRQFLLLSLSRSLTLSPSPPPPPSFLSFSPSFFHPSFFHRWNKIIFFSNIFQGAPPCHILMCQPQVLEFISDGSKITSHNTALYSCDVIWCHCCTWAIYDVIEDGIHITGVAEILQACSMHRTWLIILRWQKRKTGHLHK